MEAEVKELRNNTVTSIPNTSSGPGLDGTASNGLEFTQHLSSPPDSCHIDPLTHTHTPMAMPFWSNFGFGILPSAL